MDKGEYWVRVEDDGDSSKSISQTVLLNQDKVLEVNLEKVQPLEKSSTDLKGAGMVGEPKAQDTRNIRYTGKPSDLIFDIIAALFSVVCIIVGIVNLVYGEVAGVISILLGVIMGGLRIWARKYYYIS